MQRNSMTNMLAAQQQHEQHAVWVEKKIEGEAALRRSRQIEAFQKELNDVVNFGLKYQGEFGQWAHDVEVAWSKSPKQYDAGIHDTIKDLRSKWFSNMGRLVGLLDDAQELGVRVDKVADVRKCYAVMLSVQTMDHGDMPCHLRSMAREALDEHRAGQTEEMV